MTVKVVLWRWQGGGMSKTSNITDQASGLRNLSRSKPVKVIAVAAGKGG